MSTSNLSFDPVSAGISAATGVVGSVVNAVQNRKARKWQSKELAKQRNFESSQAELTRNWQEMMWNAQNEYNSPLNQMKLFQQAGGNPVDFFGGNTSLSSDAQTAPSGAQANAPSGPSPTTLPIGSLVSDSINSIANNTLAFANARKADKESEKLEIDMKLIEQTIKKTIEETNCTKEQADLLHKQAGLYERLTEAQIKSLLSSADLAAQHVLESKQNVKESAARTAMTKEQSLGIEFDNAVKKVKADFAMNFGVILDTDGLTALITLLCGENGDKLVSKFARNVGSLFAGAQEESTSLFDRLKNWWRGDDKDKRPPRRNDVDHVGSDDH